MKLFELINYIFIFFIQRNKPKSDSDAASNAFLEVLLYCLLIIFAPIVTFFVAKNFVLDHYLEPVYSCIWSAISAVIALHVALGLFLYRAYFSEDAAAKTPTKTD